MLKTSTTNNHIAIFLPSLRGGGAERVMVTLANLFALRGYSVDLVLVSAVGPYLERVDPSVRVVDLKAGRVLKSLSSLVRYLRRERPVAMLSALVHANMVAILARLWAGGTTRIVISERNTPSLSAANNLGHSAKIMFGLMRWLYPRADGIVAVSEGVADDLAHFARLPRYQIKVVYNPFDINRIQVLAHETLEHPWFVDGQPPVVLGVGRLTEQKDFPLLLHAFSHLRSKRPLRLMILGEGELRGELEALADSLGLSENDFSMPGFVSNPFAYYARCGVFVLSSRWEGLPGVLIEAMAAGAQVVSTDCPSGPAEILENGRWGYLFPVGDVVALEAAIALTLDATDYKNVYDRAAEFSMDRSTAGYLQALFPETGDLAVLRN